MDNTSVHPLCVNQAHLIDLHLWRGAPQNLDESRPIQILVNHGYIVGFSPDRLQPAWSAYRVAYSADDVDYDRPLFYYDDMRLEKKHRIGQKTFGKLGGIRLNVGHMTPNEVINRQFGRLAQMETFMMSNMSPQFGSLNGGVWLKLENAIRAIKDEPKKKDHVWIIVGPIFSSEPVSIKRGQGKNLPIPDAYFCIAVDPHTYPYDTLSRVNLDCFIIPQSAPSNSFPEDYPATLSEIEEITKLKFFDGYGREPIISSLAEESSGLESRLMQSLNKNRLELKSKQSEFEKNRYSSETIDDLVELLREEADLIKVQSSPQKEGVTHLQMIQHTVSFLLQARDLSTQQDDPVDESNFITYKITSDRGDKLKRGARIACNFWNRFIEPNYSIVIRLGTFTENSGTIARAYKPYEKDNVRYGKVDFNTRYLGQFNDEDISGTIIHEIGHSLGIGWDEWANLFDNNTGKFDSDAISRLARLADMEVELDGGPGTAKAHWDEDKFDKELMTGIKDNGEYVLPVTIDVMKVLGHRIKERLEEKTDLSLLLQEASNVLFSRQNEVLRIDLDYFKKTELLETIPHT